MITSCNQVIGSLLRNRWIRLAIGVGWLWFSIFILAPFLQGFRLINEVHQRVSEYDLKATALFYTDLDEPLPVE